MINTKNLKINSLVSIIYQILTVVIGLILPRFILKAFGSEINGLQASITQFLSIINFFELGVGSVVQSALYIPLAQQNTHKIVEILTEAQSFFKKLALILVVYVILLLYFFPYVVDSPLSDLNTQFLIIAMASSLFAQFYFGLTNQLFLNADQKNYIPIIASIITIILNAIVTLFLIYLGFNIGVVKFASGLIFILKPLFLKFYVQKYYNLTTTKPLKKNSIPQKWNGMANHIAYVILDSTDIVVLTLFSSLENVSIYTVHNLVVNGMKLFIQSLTVGLHSFFGSLIAREKFIEVNSYLNKIEWLIHNLIFISFGLTGLLINSFIQLYTQNIHDVNYYVPLFSALLTLSGACFCIRIPYNAVILSAGHYKQMQGSAILESSINLLLSIILVNYYGLIGVAIGTLIAIIYRTLYFVWYLSKNIIYRKRILFWKQLFVDIIECILLILFSTFISLHPTNFIEWSILAVQYFVIAILIIIIVNFIFYNKRFIHEFKTIYSKILKILNINNY